MAEVENSEKKFIVSVHGCDEINVRLHQNSEFEISAIGCHQTLELLRYHKSLKVNIADWPLPSGQSHSELLLKELILKIQGKWAYPYLAAEICHCRAISTERVDQSILCGAHDLKSIQKATSASTACGTCHQDVMNIIKYRLGSSY